MLSSETARSEGAKMRFSQALEGYWLERKRDFSASTVRDYSLHFRRFVEFVGDGELASIDADDVRGFLNYLAEDLELSRKTCANGWMALSSFWTWAAKALGIPHVIRDQVQRPRYERPQIVPYRKEEVVKILSVVDFAAGWDTRNGKRTKNARPSKLRDRAMILMLLDTGLRASELIGLRMRDYDRSTGQVIVREGKGGKDRVVFAAQGAKAAMWRYLVERGEAGPDDLVFVTRNGTALERNSFRHLVQRLGERSGVQGITLHRFRHTFAVEFLRNGGNVLELQRLLGHAKMETLTVYVKLAEADLERAQRAASPADRWGLR